MTIVESHVKFPPSLLPMDNHTENSSKDKSRGCVAPLALTAAAILAASAGYYVTRSPDEEVVTLEQQREGRILDLQSAIMTYRTDLMRCFSYRSPDTTTPLRKSLAWAHDVYRLVRPDLNPGDSTDYGRLLEELDAESAVAVGEVTPQTTNTQNDLLDIDDENNLFHREISAYISPEVIDGDDPNVNALRVKLSGFRDAVKRCLDTHNSDAAEEVDEASLTTNTALLLENPHLTPHQRFSLMHHYSTLSYNGVTAVGRVLPQTPEIGKSMRHFSNRSQLAMFAARDDEIGLRAYLLDRNRIGNDDARESVSDAVWERYGDKPAEPKK